MSNRGVGRLLVIVIEGINLVACDPNGKTSKTGLRCAPTVLAAVDTITRSWKWFLFRTFVF